jgi:hypothetical protein
MATMKLARKAGKAQAIEAVGILYELSLDANKLAKMLKRVGR